MNALHLLAAGMMVCVATASAWADEKKDKPDNAKLLVGKWEVTATKAGEAIPVGSSMEFSKDGKFKTTWKEQTLNGVYKLDDGKIQITFDPGEKAGRPLPLTIKKISEKELVLEAKEGVTIEFKRR
jgi:uncharacterized protein (TIGR03066 family)